MATPESRTIILPRRAATPAGFIPATIARRWPDKKTGEALDYAVDFRHLLEDEETISVATAAVTPSQSGGLTIAETTISSSTVSVWVDLGVAGQDYSVMVTIGTSGGRTIQFSGSLYVVDTL